MLRAGIVGLPNVGKSTLFNALTRTRKAEAANYPFCTIEPNVGVVTVPDARLAPLAHLAGSAAAVPAAIEIVDIAGLVRGASRGEGLGNRFLAHVREVDAIVEVVRCFEDPDVVHVEAELHPVSDIETIQTELVLADLESMERQKERLERAAKSGERGAKAEVEFAVRLLAHLDAGRPALVLDMTPAERERARAFHLLTMKPTLFACNVAEGDLAAAPSDPRVAEVTRWAEAHRDAEAVAVSARIEAELAELPEAEAREYLASLGVAESGVGRLIRAVHHLLGLRTFFTANEKEARAWTIPAGTPAHRAAGVVHTDFERGFVRAEVVAVEALLRAASWAHAREQGLTRLEGRDYEVRDGDVLHFRHNL
ncbi:MAG: redox-regulated ATPase YchF [Thermoanaerobaculia bacterium]|nr:MAG: redox-regulated ATPase YchF [Thermoanaerobaculia bacterium]